MRSGRGYGGGGMGQGTGRGGGRGQGTGQGRGNGHGMGRCQRMFPVAGSIPDAKETGDTTQQAQRLGARAQNMAHALTVRVQDMMNRLGAVTHRTAELEGTSVEPLAPPREPSPPASYPTVRSWMVTAAIDQEQCTCCGLCIDICPLQAISLNDAVMIDSSKCTGCGACVSECPNEAISLSRTERRAAP